MNDPKSKYATYDEVPFFRKQWFFWSMWFSVAPIAVAILITGTVYYSKKGEVRSFGIANRIAAGLIALFWSYRIVEVIAGA